MTEQEAPRDAANAGIRRFSGSEAITQLVYFLSRLELMTEPEAAARLETEADAPTSSIWQRLALRWQRTGEITADEITAMGTTGYLKTLETDLAPRHVDESGKHSERVGAHLRRLSKGLIKLLKYLGFDYVDGRFAAIEKKAEQANDEPNPGKLVDALSDRIREYAGIRQLQQNLFPLYEQAWRLGDQARCQKILQLIEALGEAAPTVAAPSIARAEAEAQGYSVEELAEGSSLSRNFNLIEIALLIGLGHASALDRALAKTREMTESNQALAAHRRGKANWRSLPESSSALSQQEGRQRATALTALMDRLTAFSPQELNQLKDSEQLNVLVQSLITSIIPNLPPSTT